MTLKQELQKLKEQATKNVSEEMNKLHEKAMLELEKLDLINQSLNIGDLMPAFSLNDINGNLITSDQLLAHGPLIISFNRGDWCEYCNLELDAYEEIIDQIKAANVSFISISPQLPNNLYKKMEYNYPILVDINNDVARKFGIVYHVHSEIYELYKHHGYEMENTSTNKLELPLAATFVINQDKQVIKVFVDTDYKTRLEPLDALNAAILSTKA